MGTLGALASALVLGVRGLSERWLSPLRSLSLILQLAIAHVSRYVADACAIEGPQDRTLCRDVVVDGSPGVLEPHKPLASDIPRDVSTRSPPTHACRYDGGLAHKVVLVTCGSGDRKAIPRSIVGDRISEGSSYVPKDVGALDFGIDDGALFFTDVAIAGFGQ